MWSRLEIMPPMTGVARGFITSAPWRVWDDSGTGGREGSLWVNSMGLLLATAGHRAPEEDTFELREDLSIF